MRAIIEDYLIGSVFGFVTCIVLGWYFGLACSIVCGILWVLGGRGFIGSKVWRRLGVPLLISLQFATNGHILGSIISFLLQIGWQTAGYGEPSPGDSGSWLGRLLNNYTRPVWLGVYALTLLPLLIK